VPGMPFNGSYTFNLAMANTNPGQPLADYEHAGGVYGIVIQVGSRTFQTDQFSNRPGAPFKITIQDDNSGHDGYRVASDANLYTGGYPVEQILWDLTDATQERLSSVALSSVPPDLAAPWDETSGLYIWNQGGTGMIRGQVTSVALGAPGAQGPQGLPGPPGLDGQPGPTGTGGIDGPRGPQGPIGSQGPSGPSGSLGAVGDRGGAGPAGPLGAAGPVGVAGAAGPIGSRGNGLFPGSLFTMPHGAPAPGGYTFLGAVELPRGSAPGKIVVDLYRRN
jgi:hypothetical protein